MTIVYIAKSVSLMRLIKFVAEKTWVRVILYTILFPFCLLQINELLVLTLSLWGKPAQPIHDYLSKRKGVNSWTYVQQSSLVTAFLRVVVFLYDITPLVETPILFFVLIYLAYKPRIKKSNKKTIIKHITSI